MSPGAAEGLLVLDLTNRVAGAYCTKLLADYGARVIKIEPPGLGDRVRRLRPFPADRPDLDCSGFFLYLNTNKESIVLDLETRTGQDLFRRLAEKAGLIVETPAVAPGQAASTASALGGSGLARGFRSLRGLGLGLEDLEASNPGLVVASISDFGSDGPYASYQATDAVTFALGGWMYAMGDPDKPPLQPGGPYGEFVAGLYAAAGALIALECARVSGRGQEVEVSIQEAVASVLPYDTVAFSYSGNVRKRTGHRYMGSPWTAVMPCKDGYVQYQNSAPGKWPAMLQMIGRPELAQDARFSTPQDQVEHADELEAIIGQWLQERTRDEIFQEALRHRLIFSWVPSVADLMAADHHRERQYWVEISHPRAGRLTYPGAPFRMELTPWAMRRPAPLLSEHNEAVFQGMLGLTHQEMVALRERGII